MNNLLNLPNGATNRVPALRRPQRDALGYSEVRVMRFCVFCHSLTDSLDRYYHQRFSIFSKYDEGVWMTEDAWFGVTPEPVAS